MISSVKKISVIGSGSWGSALALTLARSGRDIILWGHNKKRVAEIKSSRKNEAYLPEITFPENIHLTSSLAEAADAEVTFFVVPSKFLRAVALSFVEESSSTNTIFVTCTKGIEYGTGKLMSEILSEIMPASSIAVLSGPNLAVDIAMGLPAAGVVGGSEKLELASLQKIFHGTNYRVYTSNDVRGIQLGGALKNIFAIAAGVCDGLGMGENAKAGIVTRSLVEMTRLGVAMGGERKTFYGLSGIGDLMVTCFSRQSRNYQVGVKLCQGKSSTEIQDSMTMVAEGLVTARNAQLCAKQLGIDVPIIDQVVAVLDKKRTPSEAMSELLGREMKSEEEN